MSVQQTKRASIVVLASVLFGAVGFVATTAIASDAPVAAFCEDDACSIFGDCTIKNGWNCDEEPHCTHTQCAVT